MIWFLIGIILVIIGIVVFPIITNCDNCDAGGIKEWIYYNDDITGGISLFGLIIGILILSICTAVTILNHTNVDREILLWNAERNKILQKIECLDSEYEEVSKIDVIEEVYEWNRKVESYKHYSNSPWSNWLHSQKVANSLEYIEMGDIK